MVIRFCPDLTLGTHIATSIPDALSVEVIEDDDVKQNNEIENDEPVFIGTETEADITTNLSDYESVEDSEVSDGELSDYGYDQDSSDLDKEDSDMDDDGDGDNDSDDPDIGPEDGEEPLNEDAEILNTERYAAL